MAQSPELQQHLDAFQELDIAKDASFEHKEGQLVEDISRSDLQDIIQIGMGYTEGDNDDIDC
ncbi:hypothetical protein EST38_g12304 [Candolleomyces aberdarensis]|uniref:Uncharacterized protein n=1 Tax=Candolleomyces aberdarensis TaxID=2316362 RepID=A0A4V1Q219_9AGAR|nr:hypothetical protein EST38_g12304 [Candolleomyces aberdarensis]